MTRPLGRLPAPDPRDRAFLLSALLPAAPLRTRRFYWSGWQGDQGLESSCVGFAWTHYLVSGPTTQAMRDWQSFAPEVYRQAQLIDEWPGEEPSYFGTSVRAGVKVLQATGYVTEYRWAFTADEVVRAVLDVGPVVVGTVWTEAMFTPDPQHYVRPDGAVAGGHAYLIDGANLDKGYVRLKNSWGRGWGRNGRAYMTISHLAHLLDQDGEAAVAAEVRL